MRALRRRTINPGKGLGRSRNKRWSIPRTPHQEVRLMERMLSGAKWAGQGGDHLATKNQSGLSLTVGRYLL